jgi:hypothetical protein
MLQSRSMFVHTDPTSQTAEHQQQHTCSADTHFSNAHTKHDVAAAFYDEGIQTLVQRYDKCLNNDGNYVEK